MDLRPPAKTVSGPISVFRLAEMKRIYGDKEDNNDNNDNITVKSLI